MIREIEIICKPCHKCQILEQQIRTIMRCIEFKNQIKISYSFKHNTNVREAEKYGFNLSQLPLTLINRQIAFVGKVKGERVIRVNLEEFMRAD